MQETILYAHRDPQSMHTLNIYTWNILAPGKCEGITQIWVLEKGRRGTALTCMIGPEEKGRELSAVNLLASS